MARNQVTWPPIIARAKEIVESFDTPITLRRLFYLLVSEGVIENKAKVYGRLSELTAPLRRSGDFPELLDLTRDIHQEPSWASPSDLLKDAANWYRLDRTEG